MAHRWKFVRVGGFDQVDITSGADLQALAELDQKLWAALACPTKGLELDERTLTLIDADHDGRIRAPELLAAVKWGCAMLRDPDDFMRPEDGVPLRSIDDSTEEGKLLLQTAKTLLATLGKKDAEAITIADVEKALEAFSKEAHNGDGIVPEDAASDDETKALIRDVLSCMAVTETDKSGKPGVSAKDAATFFEAIDAYAAWLAKGKNEKVRPLGDETAAAYAAFAAVKSKIEDHFTRVKLALYDARALVAMNAEEKQFIELSTKELSASASEIANLPLARVVPNEGLPLRSGINPAWAARLADFETKVVKPLLGERTMLLEADFAQISLKFEHFEAWQKDKAGVLVEKLGEPRVLELHPEEVRKELAQLIADDAAKEPEAKAIESVEKLVRLRRDLLTLVNNFVSFRDFYARKSPAIFQVGTLYLDQRASELCVRVADAARHVTMAPLSNTYLVYADAKNAKGETMQIAAAMTAGDVDNLMVGRNGLFYDRKGQDWDATVTRIVDQPISIRQAFFSPYKKALRMIEEQIAKRAASEAEASDTAMTETVDSVSAGTAEASPPRSRFDVGTVAALGVAVGGITAALGAMLSAFFGLGLWMPLGVVGLVLAISGPSMAVAWLKLRKRNLGPILDANGWAVNARAVVNVPFGESLTKVATLPKGSSRELSDPFAEKKRPWGVYLALALILAVLGSWYLGKLDRYLPEAARSSTVLGDAAPSAVPVTPPETAPAPAPAAP